MAVRRQVYKAIKVLSVDVTSVLNAEVEYWRCQQAASRQQMMGHDLLQLWDAEG